MGIFFTSQPFIRKMCLFKNSLLNFIPKFLISDITSMPGAILLSCQGRIPDGLYANVTY